MDGYFESEEFRNILKSYEDNKADGLPCYMDSDDFIDVIDYYMRERRFNDALQCSVEGLTIHPADSSLLGMKISALVNLGKSQEAREELKGLNAEDNYDYYYFRAQITLDLDDDCETADVLFHKWMALEKQDIAEDRSAQADSQSRLSDDYMHIIACFSELTNADNTAVPVGELIDCLDEQVQKGRIRWIGCSNWTLDRVKEAAAYSQRTGKARFVVNQLMWSLAKINRAGIPDDYVLMDKETMAFSAENAMGIMCYTSLARGYFTKRWKGMDLGTDLTKVYQNLENDRIFEEIRQLPSAETVTRHCLRYFVDQPVTAVPIVTCNNADQLSECCAAFRL